MKNEPENFSFLKNYSFVELETNSNSKLKSLLGSLSLHALMIGALYTFVYFFSLTSSAFNEQDNEVGKKFNKNLTQERGQKKEFLLSAQILDKQELHQEIQKIQTQEQQKKELQKKAIEKHQKELQALEKKTQEKQFENQNLDHQHDLLIKKQQEIKKDLSNLNKAHQVKRNEFELLEKNLEEIEHSIEKHQVEHEIQMRAQSFAQNVLKESLYSDGSLIKKYRQHLSAHLSSYWKANMIAAHDLSRECVVEVSLLPTRRIASLNITQSSGQKAFDQSALAALKKAEPFPEMSGLDQEKIPQKMRFVFQQKGCEVLNDS